MYNDGFFLEKHITVPQMYEEIDKYWKGTDSYPPEVVRAVYAQFFDSTVPAGQSIADGELHLTFGPAAFAHRDVTLLAARASFCSTRSHFVTPYTLKREIYPDPYETWGSEMYWIEMNHEFIDLVVRLRPYILDGCINVVPKVGTFVGARGTSSDNVNHSGLLRALVSEEVTRDRSLESASALRFSFQTVTGSRAEDVVKVRLEHEEELRRLHAALSGLLAADDRQGEDSLRDAMKMIEERTHELNERLRRLRRKDWFEAMKLALTPLPFVVPLVLPAAFASVVAGAAGLLGTSNVIDLIQYRTERRAARREIEGDPFYVPWLSPLLEQDTQRR